LFGTRSPQEFLVSLVALVIAISIHEFAHAVTADALGDHTARNQGRITLNPLSHFDPLGFIMLCLLAAGFFGFAWGRPVPVNPYALRGGRRGMALVAFAGPLSNLIQAAVALFVVRTGLVELSGPLELYVYMNILLAAFNMLPVPPLDGYNVLMGLVSNFWVQRLEPLRTAGAPLLLLLVFFGGRFVYPYTVTPMFQLFARVVGYA
jgi:Zn-dependent protease